MFKNNIILCRLILRRDWLRILIWFAAIAALVIGFGGSLPHLYGSPEGRQSMLTMMENPALIAMVGPVYLTPDGSFTLGAMYSLFMTIWTAAIMAIMNIFHVLRHTRQDEELGRIEMIRSLPVGRLSNLSAAMTSAVIINTVFAVLLGFGLGFSGTEDMNFVGAMLFGAAIGAVGLVFASITAIFCQLCQNPRTASSLSFTTLGSAFMLRAIGDMQGIEALSLISPLGLIMRTKIYTQNTWLPVFISLVITLGSSIIAFLLCLIRDLGEGLVPARPGKKDASSYLKSPEGLAWRLLRVPFIIWSTVVFILGMSYGSIMGDVSSFIESTPILMQVTGGDPLGMVGFLMVIMSICATIPVLQFALKARGQEKGGYAEHIIARSASRHSQLRGYFIVALISCVLMPFLNCLGFWAGSTPVMDKPFAFGSIFNACMVYVPAMLFVLGVAVLLIGILPRFTSFAWGYLGYAFGVLYLGTLMGLPEWIGKLSPFAYIPQLPAEKLDGPAITAMTVMSVIALLMFFFGFSGHRNRDMQLL